MSTGKIGRTLNPRAKVTPGYTSNPNDQEVKKHELLEKIDEVVGILQQEFRPLVEVVEIQNNLIEKLILRLDKLEVKITNLEKENKTFYNEMLKLGSKINSLEQDVQLVIKNTEKVEEPEEKKSWFK